MTAKKNAAEEKLMIARIAELEARLAASSQTIEELRVTARKADKPGRQTPGKAKMKAEWTAIPAPTADAETIEGRAQRLDRDAIIPAIERTLRYTPGKDLANLLLNLIDNATANGGYDGEQTPAALFEKVLTVKEKKPRKTKEEKDREEAGIDK